MIQRLTGDDDRPLMTADDVAVRLRLHKRTVEKMTAAGILSAIRVGDGTRRGAVRYLPADIDAYIEERKDSAANAKFIREARTADEDVR